MIAEERRDTRINQRFEVFFQHVIKTLSQEDDRDSCLELRTVSECVVNLEKNTQALNEAREGLGAIVVKEAVLATRQNYLHMAAIVDYARYAAEELVEEYPGTQGIEHIPQEIMETSASYNFNGHTRLFISYLQERKNLFDQPPEGGMEVAAAEFKDCVLDGIAWAQQVLGKLPVVAERKRKFYADDWDVFMEDLDRTNPADKATYEIAKRFKHLEETYGISMSAVEEFAKERDETYQ